MLFFIFVKEKGIFIKGCPKATEFIIFITQERSNKNKGVNVMENVIFINEKKYQEAKKKLNKKDDWINEKEYEEIIKK